MTQTLKARLQGAYTTHVRPLTVITDTIPLSPCDIYASNVSVHACSEGGYLVHLGGCPWLHYDVFAFGMVMYYYRPWRALHPKREERQ
jgi:hypothetical protein